MVEDKRNQITFDAFENRYMAVIATSKRARQILDRAEKRNMTVDTEKVIQQALNEFYDGKISVFVTNAPPATKKRSKEKD